MNTRRIVVSCFAATLVSIPGFAAVVAPYIPDAATIALYHFDELPGASDPGNPFVNFGNGGAGLDLSNTGGPDGRDNTGGGGYGAAGYTGFGSSFNALNAGNGTHHSEGTSQALGGGAGTSGSLAQSSLQGSDGAFTYEAIINFTGITLEQTILAHDGLNGSRGFLFRVAVGNLSFYNGATETTRVIPTTGDHAFAPGSWFHIAVSYNGQAGVANNATLYWTALGSTATQANSLGSFTLASDVANATNPLAVGATTRFPFRFEGGLIDEVRISSVARGANEFIFVPEPGSASLLLTGLAAAAVRRPRRR